MIKLYHFFPAWGLPDPSPFCLKLMTWMRMAEIPYTPIGNLMNLRKAPKAKLPFIEDEGRIIADSSLAIAYLTEKYAVDLDKHLSHEQKQQCLLYQRTTEEHAYWTVLYSRWIDEENWPACREAFFGKLPFPIRGLIAGRARKGMKKEMWGHGIGRHDKDTIYAMGRADLEAVTTPLRTNPYMMGGEPCSLDASIYAFMAQLVYAPFKHPFAPWLAEHHHITAYCDRMRARYFPEPEADAMTLQS